MKTILVTLTLMSVAFAEQTEPKAPNPEIMKVMAEKYSLPKEALAVQPAFEVFRAQWRKLNSAMAELEENLKCVEKPSGDEEAQIVCRNRASRSGGRFVTELQKFKGARAEGYDVFHLMVQKAFITLKPIKLSDEEKDAFDIYHHYYMRWIKDLDKGYERQNRLYDKMHSLLDSQK